MPTNLVAAVVVLCLALALTGLGVAVVVAPYASSLLFGGAAGALRAVDLDLVLF